MDKQLTQILNKVKFHKLHPVLTCAVVRDALKKHNREVTIKRGYLNTDEFGSPVSSTYFWLEDQAGTKLDILKILNNTQERYFLTEEKLAGIECIDDLEPDTTIEIDRLWMRVKNNKYTADVSDIMKKIIN